MRLTLMVLSILRVLPMARTVFIVLLSALFLADSASSFAATHHRAHRKAAASEHRTHATAHSRKSSAAQASTHHARRSTAHRRRASVHHARRGAHYVRTAETRTRIAHVPEAAPAETVLRSEPVLKKTPAISAPAGELAAPAALPAAAITSAPMHAIPLHSEIVVMPPLRGSMESLVRQNEKTDADNLERIQDDDDLRDRIAHGVLVPVPTSAALTVNQNLPPERRYCRPWTASFLSDLASAHDAEFHSSLEVSSAVRTVEYQKHLMRVNGNAAAAVGDVASPHLTGATIDIAKHGLSRREIYWMRDRLSALQDEGKIDVEEEFRQACFHITVYKSYIGAGPAHKPHRMSPPQQAAPAIAEDDPNVGN